MRGDGLLGDRITVDSLWYLVPLFDGMYLRDDERPDTADGGLVFPNYYAGP